MSFQAITNQEIATGGPIQNPTLVKIQNDLQLHDTEITALQSTLSNPEPIMFEVRGSMAVQVANGNTTGLEYKRVWANITLTAGRIFVIDAGTSGTLQIDVQYKRGAGAWTSIFSAQPSSAYTDGSLFTTSNGVLSITQLLAGDILRLNVSSGQTGNQEFQVELPYQLT